MARGSPRQAGGHGSGGLLSLRHFCMPQAESTVEGGLGGSPRAIAWRICRSGSGSALVWWGSGDPPEVFVSAILTSSLHFTNLDALQQVDLGEGDMKREQTESRCRCLSSPGLSEICSHTTVTPPASREVMCSTYS